MQFRVRTTSIAISAALLLAAGCSRLQSRTSYPDEKPARYYKNVATTLDHPAIHQPTPHAVRVTRSPRTLDDETQDEIRPLPLSEAIHEALMNSPIIRTANSFLTGNPLFSSPDFTPSVYDSAIQESGVLFGGIGTEAALSAFDAQFATSMTWSRQEQVVNNFFIGQGAPPGSTFAAETGAFTSQLSKQTAFGSLFTVSHNWNYTGTNARGQLFPSAYSGLVQASYQQPILAGAGTEFTRIAGPITQSFRGLSGVGQGVVIARINNDITLADFEAAIQNLLLDVENTYWDLYMSYRRYDAEVARYQSAHKTWKREKIRFDLDDQSASEEALARDALFSSIASSQDALSGILDNELRLRRLMGRPINNGEILQPSNEPTAADFQADWQSSLAEALTRRVELRRQKWQIKSLELQRRAACNLIRPRLDFIANYRVNGFGDQLLVHSDRDVVGTPQGLRSAYETLTQGDQTGWDLGFQFNLPLGMRSAHAQLRNLELRLAKARAVLQTQEHEISLELASTFQEVVRHFRIAESNFERRRAALLRVEMQGHKVDVGTETVDLKVRAQARLAEAETAFYQSLVDYNKQIAHLHYRKGTLLDYNNVQLAEAGWEPGAYEDAMSRALERTHGKDAPKLMTEPLEFASPFPAGHPEFAPLNVPAPNGEVLPSLFPAPESESLNDNVPQLPQEQTPEDTTREIGDAAEANWWEHAAFRAHLADAENLEPPWSDGDQEQTIIPASFRIEERPESRAGSDRPLRLSEPHEGRLRRENPSRDPAVRFNPLEPGGRIPRFPRGDDHGIRARGRINADRDFGAIEPHVGPEFTGSGRSKALTASGSSREDGGAEDDDRFGSDRRPRRQATTGRLSFDEFIRATGQD